MPFVFRCGRVMVLVLDSRGERDVFRADIPILGARQWQFIDRSSRDCQPTSTRWRSSTATPIASQDPDGQTQRLMGDRTDDVEAFKRGDEEELFHPKSNSDPVELAQVDREREDRPPHRHASSTSATSRSPTSTRRATSGRTASPAASSRTC